MYKDWKKNFRHLNFRKGQDTAGDSIACRLDVGQKFVIAELPTGLGKSDCAVALARSAPNRAYITTPQNILIDQYSKDFGQAPWFHLIKGKRHYTCKTPRFNNCEAGIQGKCVFSRGEDAECEYKVERALTMISPVALTNASYFALACRNTDLWVPRSLAVIDEAHNLADAIMGLTSIEITDSLLFHMQIYHTIPTALCKSPIVDVGAFGNYIADLKKELVWSLSELQDRYDVDSKVVEKMEALAQCIDGFEKSVVAGVRWVVDYDMDQHKKDRLIARPVDTAYLAKDLFFSKQATQYVLQSATIVDFKRYAEELGITDAWKVVRESPFDPDRSPVYPLNIGSMNYKNIDDSLPKIASAVATIIESRPTQKGLVHTGSNRVTEYLAGKLGSNVRCLFPVTSTREAALQQHFSSAAPTVLFSPSMTEGVDGKDDFLRFQIICKIPYPSLADRRVKIKADESNAWYLYQTAKQLIQAKGRGMRSETDWCETYILDSEFASFMSRADIPKDFTRCIREKVNLKLV